VPGTLRVTVRVPRVAPEGDRSGFVSLGRDGNGVRIPLWYRIERPKLPLDRQLPLPRPGTYRGNTSRGGAHVASYRYPDIPPGGMSFPVRLPGREVVYRVRIRRPVANFGAAVTSAVRGVRVEPRIVRSNDENRLAGYAALPFDENPYRATDGRHRRVAGVVRPAPGVYQIVFDTPRGARSGPFTFRYWQNDTRPPSVRLVGVRRGFLELAVVDEGAGVDPTTLVVRIDREERSFRYARGLARVRVADLRRGRHSLSVTVADYQETKNMENVAQVLPNTRVFATTFATP
jgi:hypothetical protein